MQVPSLQRAPLRIGRRILGSTIVEALATPNPIDRYLELVNPGWSLRDIRAEVTGVRHQTPRSTTLTIRPNDNWQGFEAGQHCGITVEIDGVRQTRFYSPACSARRGDGQIELTVTVKPGGIVSPFLREHARPGMVVGLSKAEGDFVLPRSRPGKLLLVSGGSGITPVMSILRTLCDEGYTGEVVFMHYARSAEDLLYEDELVMLAAAHPNVSVVRGITRDEVSGMLKGHFTRRHLRSAAPGYAKAETYVCGPAGLIEAVSAVWRKDGTERRLHSECFAPPVPELPAGDAEGTINFAGSGVQIDNNGGTLLEQAEAAGLKPAHGCRMGICHTCVCRMAEGTVRDVRTGEIKTITDESIQICVNAPVGDVEINL